MNSDYNYLIDLVARMRSAQQAYFKWKRQDDLALAKDLERKLDALIIEYHAEKNAPKTFETTP